jgi:hypothetical protein
MTADLPLDHVAALAKQDVATAILLPVRCHQRAAVVFSPSSSPLTSSFPQYILGLCLQILLIGVYLSLFTQHYRLDLRNHSKAVKAVSWTVFFLVLGCMGMSFEEIIDTASTLHSHCRVY